MRMSECGIAMSTVSNREQARLIADTVLGERLAACIQEIDIKSHYVWKGQVCHDDEILILMKTQKSLYRKLEQRLLEIHPYETAEIMFVDADKVGEAYGRWVMGQTGKEA